MATANVLSMKWVLMCLLGVTQALPERCYTSPALGMEDERIRVSQIMYTSVKKGTTAFGEQARLHRNIPQWGAWCPDTNLFGSSAENINYDQFIHIDLLHLTNISKIAIQGREYNGGREFVGSYKISYSKNGDDWTDYVYRIRGNLLDTILTGANNSKFVARRVLNPTVKTRHIRIHPGYKKGENVCMRLELYGCAFKEDIKGRPVKKGNSSTNTTVFAGCEGQIKNSIAMFFAGVAMTLGTVLLAVFVIQTFRRNRLVAKSTSVNAVHMQTAVEFQTEPAIEQQQENRQVADYDIPGSSRMSPNEQIQDPQLVPFPYTELDIRYENRRETNDRAYQGLLRSESDYVIPAHTVSEPSNAEDRGEVKTPLGYTELDLTKLGQECDASYQHLIIRK
ncbi:uncharacterized protein LOC114539562 [Dendronephthya gigantea]|uniref:uncharacterized protein LOC114539562 n=1 Tax=Dendronephthya gigantea TaxID=151771 RepID=UPI0010699AAA|nr:uncharacterized protein LOC114539562 [Dendronephthya gigantea]